LYDEETGAVEFHLDGFTGAAAEEGFQGDVGLEFGGEGSGPCDGGVRVGDDGPAE